MYAHITLLSLHLGIDLIQYLAKYLVKLCAVLCEILCSALYVIILAFRLIVNVIML